MQALGRGGLCEGLVSWISFDEMKVEERERD